MAETPGQTFEIVAETEAEAIAQAAATAGLSADALAVKASEPMKTLPWQRKRMRYLVGPATPPEPTDRDGSWSVSFEDGWVRLAVSPPIGGGSPLDLDDLIGASANWPVPSVDEMALWGVVERVAGDPEPVAEYEVPAEAPFAIVVSPNELQAYVVCGEGDTPNSADDISAALEDAGVVASIDDEALASLLQDWTPGRAAVVARGQPPEHGNDASVSQTFATAAEFQAAVRDDGSVDFFASQLTAPVEAETTLAEKTLPTMGTEGLSVRGAELPANQGKDVDLVSMLGEGVALSEDGLRILSKIEGEPSFTAGKYTVLPTLHIEGDVSVGTGNVDFPGNVRVGGDVQDGFTVRATGDIAVRGVVQAATLEAGGRVTLLAGMIGGEKGSITATGDVRAGFLRECAVTTDGDVHVNGEIVRATVQAKGSVQVSGAGKIIGGSITSGGNVVANAIGSPVGGAPTLIVVNVPTIQPQEDRRQRRVRPAVKVRDLTYPPTQIVIGTARRTIDSEIQYAAFTESEGKIVLAAFA